MERRDREGSRRKCNRKDRERKREKRMNGSQIMELLICSCKALTHAHLIKHLRQKLSN